MTSMELPIAELKDAQSRLIAAMNRIEEIIAEVHKLRLDQQNLADVRTKLEFLQNDLIKRQKLVSAVVKQIKKMKKFRGQGNKQMSKTYEKLQAYETEVSVLSKIQNDVATIGNKDFAELRRMMHPTAALRDLFTGIAILFKVPKWKRWHNVQSFIAKSSTKDKILALRPHHLDARTVKRVRKFLNEHEETVNRLAAYKANRKIAPLEPWLRTMVALAEKIVLYGLAPETLELELQKMQQDIKSENELTKTLEKCKAKEKDIVNAFRTIFKAKGDNFEGLRTISDFLGEEVEQDDSDLDIGDEHEESKDEVSPVSNFVKKGKRRQAVPLDFSTGVNSADVLGEASVSRRPQRAGKGSRREGRSLQGTSNSAQKKKKRSTAVLSYFSGPSNSIKGKGYGDQGATHGNSSKGPGANKRSQGRDNQLPDLADLLEENTKARGKTSKGRKMPANKDNNESRTLRSRNNAQPNESSSRMREIDLLESEGNNHTAELTLDDDPGGRTHLSISASRGSTFKPTINDFADSKWEEEEDDLSLSLDDSVSVKEQLSFCVTSNLHVSTGDFGAYKDFDAEAKADSDNPNQGLKKNPQSKQSSKKKVGDRGNLTRKGAKDRAVSSHDGSDNFSMATMTTTGTVKPGSKIYENNIGDDNDRGAKDNAISSHDGSKDFSMATMTTGTVIPNSNGHETNMREAGGDKKSDHDQKPSDHSLTMSRGTNVQAIGNLNDTSRATGNNNSSNDAGTAAHALTQISNESISIATTSLPESGIGNELGSGVKTNHSRKSLIDFADVDKVGQESCISFRESVVVESLPEIDQKEAKDEELDPELIETLVVKMRRSLRELDVDGIDLDENEEKNSDQFKDIILRYNRHRRNSINYDTDAFDIWKGMGFQFKSFKKVSGVKKKKKEIGYHVDEETPYLEHVQKMRTKRAASGSGSTLEAMESLERQRINTH